MYSGECILIIDGSRHDGCSCALEDGTEGTRSCGFLSAPSALLDKASKACRVQIQFGEHDPQKISVLAVNAGILFFNVAKDSPIRVMLSSRNWAAVVEGNSLREVCTRAEEQIWHSGSAIGPVECRVSGTDRETAASIVDYVKSVEIAEIELVRGSGPNIRHALQLAKIDRTISRGEQLVSGQRLLVKSLSQQGWKDDLPARLLANLNVSLSLLNRHRDLIRQGLYESLHAAELKDLPS
jgi:hypothetical protein